MRDQYPALSMVCWAVFNWATQRRSSLQKGVKTSAKVHHETVIERVLKSSHSVGLCYLPHSQNHTRLHHVMWCAFIISNLITSTLKIQIPEKGKRNGPLTFSKQTHCVVIFKSPLGILVVFKVHHLFAVQHKTLHILKYIIRQRTSRVSVLISSLASSC